MDANDEKAQDAKRSEVVTVEVPRFVADAGRAVRRGALWFDGLARRVVERIRGAGRGEP